MSARNPSVAKCSACGNECRRWWAARHPVDGILEDRRTALRSISQLLVGLVIGTLVFWQAPLPLVEAALLSLVFWTAYNEAINRLYHHYWAWKHPVRCQGGGHTIPAVSEGAL